MRSVTWVFFYAFSVVSLTLGFYDLYRTLPGLQDALAKLVDSYHISVWWPITSAYRWIESHAQLRLSIFLTYLFGKSELFYSINVIAVQWFWYIFEPVRAVVMPVAYVLYAPMRLLLSLWSYSLGVVYSPVTFAWSLASRVEVMQAARGSAGVGWITVSEAMRQSMVTAMRAYVYCSFSSLSLWLCTAQRVPARPPTHSLRAIDVRQVQQRLEVRHERVRRRVEASDDAGSARGTELGTAVGNARGGAVLGLAGVWGRYPCRRQWRVLRRVRRRGYRCPRAAELAVVLERVWVCERGRRGRLDGDDDKGD